MVIGERITALLLILVNAYGDITRVDAEDVRGCDGDRCRKWRVPKHHRRTCAVIDADVGNSSPTCGCRRKVDLC